MSLRRMNLFKNLLFAVLFAVTLIAGAGAAHASLGVDFTAPADIFTKAGIDNNINIIGWQFNVNESFTINGLGYFDLNGNSLLESHDVALYRSTGELVASATVNPSDTKLGNAPWRFHSISDTTLSIGQYVIAATVGNDPYTAYSPDYGTTNFTGLVFHPSITFQGDVFDDSNQALPLTWSSTESACVTGGFGPNFVATPIPAAAYLLGSGLIGLIGIRRRRMNG